MLSTLGYYISNLSVSASPWVRLLCTQATRQKHSTASRGLSSTTLLLLLEDTPADKAG
jgi:hypothetical protein